METFERDSWLNDLGINVEDGPTKCCICRLYLNGRPYECREQDHFGQCSMMHVCFKCIPEDQPERSKREDAINECKEIGHLNTWFPKDQTLCMRCGALMNNQENP